METIPGFSDYSITQDGRVWSKPRQNVQGHNLRGKWLKPIIGSAGYLRVVLSINSQRYTCSIHHLLLETYVGQCPPGMECRHLNGIRTDNRLKNLCWGTHRENQLDRNRHGTTSQPIPQRGEKNGASKLTKEEVKVIRYLYNVAKFTLADIAWQFDVAICTIQRIIKRKTWKHLDAGI